MKDTADHNVIGSNPVENDVLAVHELMRPAFIDPTHMRVVADQIEHRVELAQIFVGLPWPKLSNV